MSTQTVKYAVFIEAKCLFLNLNYIIYKKNMYGFDDIKNEDIPKLK